MEPFLANAVYCSAERKLIKCVLPCLRYPGSAYRWLLCDAGNYYIRMRLMSPKKQKSWSSAGRRRSGEVEKMGGRGFRDAAGE